MAPKPDNLSPVVALAGGVGGAKFAAGLQATLPPAALTVIVNTGDDFEHWGLTICPDVDTVLYGLAGVNNPHTGWGRAGETWAVLTETERLGGEDWFRLGDKDLALHLLRNQWLNAGVTLTEVTDRLRRKLDVPSRILPMCNQPVRTLVHTDEGDLPFQDYFVRRRCEPTFRGLTFVGAAKATLTSEVAASLRAAAQIIICPSNPYLSVDPILSVPGLRQLVQDSDAPVVAVSPHRRRTRRQGPRSQNDARNGPSQPPPAHHRRTLRRPARRIHPRPARQRRAIPPSPARTNNRYPHDRPALQATPRRRGPAVRSDPS